MGLFSFHGWVFSDRTKPSQVPATVCVFVGHKLKLALSSLSFIPFTTQSHWAILQIPACPCQKITVSVIIRLTKLPNTSALSLLLFEPGIWPPQITKALLSMIFALQVHMIVTSKPAVMSISCSGWQQSGDDWTVAFHQQDNDQCQICWFNRVTMSSMW